jgi:hypothetical protein
MAQPRDPSNDEPTVERNGVEYLMPSSGDLTESEMFDQERVDDPHAIPARKAAAEEHLAEVDSYLQHLDDILSRRSWTHREREVPIPLRRSRRLRGGRTLRSARSWPPNETPAGHRRADPNERTHTMHDTIDRLATAIERLGPTIRRVNHYYLGRAICRVWGHRWRGGTVSCRSANDYQHCVRCWLEPPPIDWDAFHEEYPEYREEAPAGREREDVPF